MPQGSVALRFGATLVQVTQCTIYSFTRHSEHDVQTAYAHHQKFE
jgi:hypothetical protein